MDIPSTIVHLDSQEGQAQLERDVKANGMKYFFFYELQHFILESKQKKKSKLKETEVEVEELVENKKNRRKVSE